MPLARSLILLKDQTRELLRERLWLQVLIGMALGIGLGILIGPTSQIVSPKTAALIGNWVALPGQLFLVSIQFVVVPLIVASVIRGICAGQGSDNIGRLGGITVAFFVATTVVAVLIGIGVALAIQPGSFIDGMSVQNALQSGSPPGAVGNNTAVPGVADLPGVIVNLFPKDPLTTFVSGNMLQIVITATIFGIALLMMPTDQSKPLLDLLASLQAACMIIVKWVLRFAPFAVFGLLAQITARVGLTTLIGTGVYVLAVAAALAILFLLYTLLAVGIGRRSPRRFLSEIREVLLLAFSTSSSAAVMPLTLSTAETTLNVKPFVARFVIPLGTTINMGGTAVYQGVATLFLAQVFGVEIGLSGMLLLIVMATGAAIGSPGTPGVGIVILATILGTVGVPPTGIAIILGVDRILDMLRTVVNVTGDLTACVVIERFTGREPAEGKAVT